MAERIFIGRETEFRKLERFWGQVLAGQGQVVLVSGEAGSGKTAFIEAFIERQAEAAGAIVATGSGSAQGGVGDPYLPFREILGTLTGLIEERHSTAGNPNRLQQLLLRSTQVLVEVGPDLIGTLVPGTAILGKIGKAAAQKAGWLDKLEGLIQRKREPLLTQGSMDQGHIFEQFANFLQALATEHPLLIVLDDLHWADQASIGLFFHLYRRLEQSSVLLLGAYRSDEINSRQEERHPLEKVLAEIKRYAGDVWIDLDQSHSSQRLAFVNGLIDSEPNNLDALFRQQLFGHTGGHPLFTVELLQALKERGMLKRQQGLWITGPDLDWNTLPARIEGVIEERIGRLSQSDREILDVASVGGSVFLAEVVGQVLAKPMRPLLRDLGVLQHQHRLVQESLETGNALLTPFNFAHNLFQGYLYQNLGLGQRRLLHADVAVSLEQLYAGHLEDIYVPLAWHYDSAGDANKAAEYFVLASEQANRQGAPQEAYQLAGRATQLLGNQANGLLWKALLAQHTALLRLGKPEELGQSSQAVQQLSLKLSDPAKTAEADYRMLLWANHVGKKRQVLEAAEAAIASAQKAGDSSLQAQSLMFKMRGLSHLGDFKAAKATAQTALECAQNCPDQGVLANVLGNLAAVYDESGDPAKAVEFQSRALEVAREVDNKVIEARSLVSLGNSYRGLGLYPLAQSTLVEAIQANLSIGARRERAHALANLGLVHLALKGEPEATRLLQEAQGEGLKIGDGFLQALCINSLGYALELRGDFSQASTHFQQAQQMFEEFGISGFAMEASAGMTRCALALNQPQEASQYAAQIWDYLQTHGMDSLVVETHIACGEVLWAKGDTSSAQQVIEGGYRSLIERSYQISNLEWRSAFLQVPENAQLLQLWQKIQQQA